MTKEVNDLNSDTENYESKLLDVECEIRELDPNFEDETLTSSALFN